MTQTVSGLYRSRESAEAAAADLRQAGFAEDAINVVAPAEESDEELVASIRRGAVDEEHAAMFADAIRRGETLVCVQASFGLSARAIAVLRRHGMTDGGEFEHYPEKVPADPATPLSSACGWTVLIDNPAPLSALLNWPTLSKHQAPRSRLSGNPAPLSSALGLKVLSSEPAPLSRLFGWRVLSESPRK